MADEYPTPIGLIPVGIPIASLDQLLRPEHIETIKGSPEKLALVKQLTQHVMKNPQFMKQVEQQLAKRAAHQHTSGLVADDEVLIQRASFGWEIHPDLPSGKQAAAAVGAAVAAVAGGPAAAAVAA